MSKVVKNLLGSIIKNINRDFYKKIIDKKNINDFKRENRLNYKFDIKSYPNTFLENSCYHNSKPSFLEEVIYCFWTGENEMSENRKNGYEDLVKNAGCKVILVTPRNLHEFILKKDPLHDAYEYLTLNHRSDYLRCYFMHHYGGGFADIKPYKHSWKNSFEKLKKNKNKYVLGYREVGEYGVARLEGKLYEDLKKHYPLLIGNGAFICKSNTILTCEWYKELNQRLDVYMINLRKHDEGQTEYPIPYTGMQGDIFHPICLKFHDFILQDEDIKPIMANYK